MTAWIHVSFVYNTASAVQKKRRMRESLLSAYSPFPADETLGKWRQNVELAPFNFICVQLMLCFVFCDIDVSDKT